MRCRGGDRFRLGATRKQADGLWVGTATTIAADPVVAPSTGHTDIVKSLVDAIAALAAEGAPPVLEPHRFDDAGWVANRWCEILPIPMPAKQKLMALPDPLLRLEVVDDILRRKPVA